MIYKGTDSAERIFVRDRYGDDKTHTIEIGKYACKQEFYVKCEEFNFCCKFNMNNNSNYERVKYNVMATIFEFDNIREVLSCLKNVFEDAFADIIKEDKNYECI